MTKGSGPNIDRLKKNYWWKGIDKTVKQVIQACVPRARAKARFRVSSTELQPLRLSGVVFRWGIDFVGPLPTTSRGNRYVLVCIEHCTKWVELIPLPSKAFVYVTRAFLEMSLAGMELQGRC